MIRVLVGGVFDILHFGHITFLKEAKKLGDHLVVALESDASVKKSKGDSRPIHSQLQRKDMLLALKFVDEVITLPEMTSDSDYDQMVKKVAPQIIAVTEGDPILEKKKQQAKNVHAEVVIIPKTKVASTSQIAKLIGLE